MFIYENGCTKSHNVNLDHNDFNSAGKTSAADKNVNVGRAALQTPSPGYNRNPTPYYRSATTSPAPATPVATPRSASCEKIGTRGSLEDLGLRQNDAEVLRNKVVWEVVTQIV